MSRRSSEPEREDQAPREQRAEPSDASATGGDRPAIAAEESQGAEPRAAEPAARPDERSAEELRDLWLRAEAELQNLRRRAAREREETWRAAEESVLLELISSLDDLERALASAREAGSPESWTAGVQLTADRIRERLSRFGVAIVDPAGKPFDPRLHEALLEIDAPEGVSAGVVVEVIHKGYARGDRALRPARVVVARAPQGGAAAGS